MNCNKTTNNKYFDCPALMSDGRAFTDYRPSSYVNDLIRTTNGAYSSHVYRQYLIHNAKTLFEANNEYAKLKNGCSQCNYSQTEVPTKTTCIYNRNFGLCYPNNCDGIGISNYASPEQKMIPYNINPQTQTMKKLV
jgi:hypothetical protein